jgi:hypothetical protein
MIIQSGLLARRTVLPVPSLAFVCILGLLLLGCSRCCDGGVRPSRQSGMETGRNHLRFWRLSWSLYLLFSVVSLDIGILRDNERSVGIE